MLLDVACCLMWKEFVRGLRAYVGCWQAARGEVGLAVETALKAGYRHIDGAWAYRVSLLTM